MKPKSQITAERIIPILLVSILCGCAGKKTRLWIDPPVGTEMSDRGSQKLYYQIEDAQLGKKESLSIPIQNLPENLVVEQRGKGSPSEAEIGLATKADRQISAGQLPESEKPAAPTLSYLRGLSEVEAKYQKRLYSEALIHLAPLLEQYPKQSRLFVMQGTLFRKIGEKKLALDAYKRAQQLDPGNPALEEAVLHAQDEIGETL